MDAFDLHHAGLPRFRVQVQHAERPLGDVLYVHGATFPCELAFFFRFDGRSWADALNAAGFTAWGLDFAGYGRSARYAEMDGPADAAPPLGRLEAALPQLSAAVDFVQARNGGRPIALLAHSWGTLVAASYAGLHPERLSRLILFGPIVQRSMGASLGDTARVPAWHLVNMWQQYRRFIEDVPKDEPPVLADAHIEPWSRAYLASDPAAATRLPPAVKTPAGPLADLIATWRGQWRYDPASVATPLLVVRGAWDASSTDADAARLLSAVGARERQDVRIPRATHLMHLESGRLALQRAVNDFLTGDLA